MAGESSCLGFLRNEVVLGKMWSQSVVVESESVRVRNVVKVVALPVLCRKNRRVVVANVSKSNPLGESQSGVASVSVSKEGSNSDSGLEVKVDIDGNGGGDVLGGSGNGRFSSGGGGGGGGDGGDDNGDDKEEDEFGPILKFEEVMKETEARGVSLPSNMLEAAKSVGIRKLFLLRYLDLQGSGWLLGFAMKSCSMLRNRMLADPSFLFKIGTEIVIDSCCVTVVEVQNRGKDFWAEFELYVADLLVGVVVNVALVGMLAPYARIGGPSISKGFLGRRQHAYGALPSSVFEAERPGCRFTVKQRIGTYFYKGILCGILGFGSGIIGRGIANLIMTAKRY
nr:protein RETICULATA, chloroplastic-like isoform X2 [Quercus suber]